VIKKKVQRKGTAQVNHSIARAITSHLVSLSINSFIICHGMKCSMLCWIIMEKNKL